MTSKHVQIANINYYTLLSQANGKPPSTPPVLLIHALMANHHMWDSTVTALNNAGYNTLQVDNIGHGQTSVPANIESSVEKPAFHFDDMTRHLREIVLAVTGQERVEAVMGCSMGGILALRYGLLFPDTVNNCIVSCDAPSATTPSSSIPIWGDRIAQFSQDIAAGTETLFRATAERWVPGDDAQSERARSQAFDLARTCTLDGYRVCADGIRNYDYLPLLKGMKVRAMVLAGRDDVSIGPPEMTEQTAREIPGAELVWMENTGHLPPLQRPEEFEKVLLEFLGKGNGMQ